MPAPPPFPPIGGSLDDVNAAFHHHYDVARDDAEDAAPVFLVLTDVLVVHHRGARRELPVTPRPVQALKSMAHGAVAVFTVEHRRQRGIAPDRARLTALRAHLAKALDNVDDDLKGADATDEDRAAADDARAVLAPSLAFLDRILAVLEGPPLPPAVLQEFAGAVGPPLLRLTDHATRWSVAALHALVEEAVAPLDAAERKGLQVVVAGSHQARARSMAMQYFQQRLREPEGVEERVTYAEGIDDEAAALALVGARRLDRAIASAFFQNPRRLQRDVLGDAAAAHLKRVAFDPIV